MEEAVSSALAAAHPRLGVSAALSRRCVSVLQDDCGAYDVDGLIDLLKEGFDAVVLKLEQQAAAPLAFVTLLKKHLLSGDQVAVAGESSASNVNDGPASAGAEQRNAPLSASGGKQVSVASLLGSGSVRHFERLPTGERILSFGFFGRLRRAGQFLRIPGTVSQFLIPAKKLVQNPVLSF